MANYSLDISNAISAGWEYAKKHGILIAVIYFITGTISSLLQNFDTQNIDSDTYTMLGERIAQGDTEALNRLVEIYSNSGSWLAYIIGIVFAIIVNVGLYNLALGLTSGKYTEVCFDAFKLPLQVYLKVAIVQIVVGILTCIAALFCIIPAFYVGPRLSQAVFYIIDHPEADIMDAIKASWKMTQGNVLALIGFSIIFFFIFIIGILCCCVGYYFTLAISLFAMTAVYYQLKGNLV